MLHIHRFVFICVVCMCEILFFFVFFFFIESHRKWILNVIDEGNKKKKKTCQRHIFKKDKKKKLEFLYLTHSNERIGWRHLSATKWNGWMVIDLYPIPIQLYLRPYAFAYNPKNTKSHFSHKRFVKFEIFLSFHMSRKSEERKKKIVVKLKQSQGRRQRLRSFMLIHS